MTISSNLIQQLEKQIVQAKRDYLVRFIANSLSWIFIFAALVGVAAQSLFIGSVVLVFGLFLSIFSCLKSSAYQQINTNNLLRHLNREFDELEESAELIATQDDDLNVLQKLQRTRVETTLAKLFEDSSIQLIPDYSSKKGILSVMMIAVVITILWLLYQQNWFNVQSVFITNQTAERDDDEQTQNKSTQGVAPKIEYIQIAVQPPAYTQQNNVVSDDLNLTVLSGSVVTWKFGFSNEVADYELKFGNDERLQLIKQNDGFYQVSKVLTQTGIYSVDASVGKMEGLFSLTVLPDDKPYVRFVTPKKTITEISKNAQPDIKLEAIIGDDFGVSKVDILASIAKGSGEAVKFRDEVFSFDSSTPSGDDSIYSKEWNLIDLGMEPGDEFYFSVRVWDNKAPESQMVKSQTKIVRWLEDEQEAILSDGIVIDFIPEYFKSQRQIIIETQELIASENQLSTDEFKKTSQLLGQAQSDLKQKYGQFLGDEFGEGGADVVSEEDDFEIHSEEHDDEGEHEDESGHEAEEHEHEESSVNESSDLSGYDQVIAQYGHAHGEVDIGLITKQNPKAMMKRAIAAMWLAELHLLLSEPKLALPFENEALSFLNKAKKAERIYVKRLGFEPPPVTEERRYQGKLDDIQSRLSALDSRIDNIEQQSIEQTLRMIDRQRSSHFVKPVTEDEQKTLRGVTQFLLKNTESEPQLIQQVATIEKIIIGESFSLEDCESCLAELEQRLWTFISNDQAVPTRSNGMSEQTQLGNRFLELLYTPSNDKPRGLDNE